MRRPVRLPSLIGLMGAVAVAACSLTSLDGFSEGEGADAGTDGPAASDAAPKDGAGPDSFFDAGSAQAFCASLDAAAVTLCADFDDADAALPAPFGKVITASAGTVTLDVADSRSAPRSVLFVAGRADGESAAGLGYTSSPISSSVSVDLDLRVDAFGSGDFDVLVIERTTIEVGFQINSNGTLSFDVEVPDGSGGRRQTETPIGATVGAAWRHLRLEAAATTGNADWNVKMLVDGVQSGITTAPSAGIVGQPNVVVGDGRLSASSTPWRVRVDNVVVRAK